MISYSLSLFQIRHFVLTDLRLALSTGGGEDRRDFGELDYAPKDFVRVLILLAEDLSLSALRGPLIIRSHFLCDYYYFVLVRVAPKRNDSAISI